MQSKNSFVAGLFVFAIVGFVGGGIETYEHIDYRLNAQPAQMSLADPNQRIVEFDDVLSVRTIDVKYVSEAGEVVVRQKVVPNDVFDRLADGESVRIVYLRNNTNRVFYHDRRPPIPWGWLIFGVISLIVAMYALKLRKREAGLDA